MQVSSHIIPNFIVLLLEIIAWKYNKRSKQEQKKIKNRTKLVVDK